MSEANDELTLVRAELERLLEIRNGGGHFTTAEEAARYARLTARELELLALVDDRASVERLGPSATG